MAHASSRLEDRSEKRPDRPPPPPFGGFGPFGPGDPDSFLGGGPGFPGGPPLPPEAVAWASGYGNLTYFDAKYPFWHLPPFGSYGHLGGDPFLFPGGSGLGFPRGGFAGYPSGGVPGFSGGDVPRFPGVPPPEAVAWASGYSNLKYFDAKHPFLASSSVWNYGHFGGDQGHW